jgi:hypothetical protein
MEFYSNMDAEDLYLRKWKRSYYAWLVVLLVGLFCELGPYIHNVGFSKAGFGLVASAVVIFPVLRYLYLAPQYENRTLNYIKIQGGDLIFSTSSLSVLGFIRLSSISRCFPRQDLTIRQLDKSKISKLKVKYLGDVFVISHGKTMYQLGEKIFDDFPALNVELQQFFAIEK